MATIPEKDLRLLRTRSDLTLPYPPAQLTQEVVETRGAGSGPASEAGGNQKPLPPPEGPAQTETMGSGGKTGEVLGPAKAAPPPPPEPPTPSSRSSPPSPTHSVVSRGSSKYDKHKDGSYWKILACIIQIFVETV